MVKKINDNADGFLPMDNESTAPMESGAGPVAPPKTTETAIERPGATSALATPEILGLDDFDDFVVPRNKIVQPTSQTGTRKGTFFNNLTGAEVDSIDFVLLAAKTGRVMWNPKDLKSDPICKSNDGIHPADIIEKPISQVCGLKAPGVKILATCPKAGWTKNFNGIDERPECNETKTLLAVNLADDCPFFLSLHGVQLKPIKSFLSGFIAKKKSPLEFKARMSLREQTNGKGIFYVIVFSNVEENSEADKEKYKAMFYQLSGYNLEKTYDAERKMESDTANMPF